MKQDQTLNLELSEKRKLIEKALKIVDKLADNSLADVNSDDDYEKDFKKIQSLIVDARILKMSEWWQKILEIKY